MNEVVFLEIEDVIEIQRMQIEGFGGESGLLNQDALEAACHAPRKILYYEDGDLVDCTAAIMWHVCADHPFVDGNKRTAFAATYTFLAINGTMLTADSAESYAFISGLYDAGTFNFDNLRAWLYGNVARTGA